MSILLIQLCSSSSLYNTFQFDELSKENLMLEKRTVNNVNLSLMAERGQGQSHSPGSWTDTI